MAGAKLDPSVPPDTPPPSNDIPHPQSQSQPQPQPQPQQQPQSQSKSQSQSQSQSQPRTAGTNAKEYYGYLFNKDKSATHVLDALLRAIGQYISTNIGDTNVRELTPKKLAAFYRAVGGDYDQLFISCPYQSISYIWQALGVEHTLQPTENPFEPPSIPALTIRGFVRWETIQILLEPQEHVPFMQFAVRHWGLINPDTRKPFPVDLPSEAFPTECDPEIDAWHKECAKKLREEATPKDEHPPRRPASDPRIHNTFAHVRNPQSTGAAPRPRPEMDYFQRQRPVKFTHVPSSHYTGPYFSVNYAPGQRRVSSSNSSSSGAPDSPPRRRSHSDVRHSEMEEPHISSHLDPRRPPGPRRHSHSRPYSTAPSDSDSDIIPPRPSSKSRVHGPIPPTASVRRMPVVTPVVPPVPIRPRRSEVRPDDPRRRSLPAEVKHRITSFLSGSADRHRSNSREKRHPPPPSSGMHFRREHSSRPSRSVSGGDSYPSDDSDPDIAPRFSARRERERLRDRVIEKERLREREREREREEELERRSRERGYLRPGPPKRASSHADIDRRTRDYGWDRRDSRDRSTDMDRDGRRVVTADERETRERRRYKERGYSPIVTGVGGRRYPEEPGWK
ncbi:hypothetical protein F4776DRAFT_190340 [Hypoxylon sp. NC0597]|nr:hypothetical protein F4776DRAFT_190340 [Hypoxylon sp. NC0597]